MKSLVLLMLLCAGCAEEPDRLVGATTADGRFKLSLEAVDDWVRPGFSLPVKVRVESLLGPLTQPWQAELQLVANNGDVSSSWIDVEFDGVAEDEIADRGDSVFEKWFFFEAESRVTTTAQGEIHALFLNEVVALKIRIEPGLVE